MTNARLILLALAAICFLLAIVDWPRGASVRTVALGLLLLTVAQLVGTR